MTDTASTSAYVKELLSNDEEVTQAPPAKCKRTYDLWRSHKCAIEAPPADHWSEDDFIDIYGSVDGDITGAAGLKEDPWLVIIRSAPFASFAPQCSHSALSAYMCDGQVACSIEPAVSDFVNISANWPFALAKTPKVTGFHSLSQPVTHYAVLWQYGWDPHLYTVKFHAAGKSLPSVTGCGPLLQIYKYVQWQCGTCTSSGTWEQFEKWMWRLLSEINVNWKMW